MEGSAPRRDLFFSSMFGLSGQASLAAIGSSILCRKPLSGLRFADSVGRRFRVRLLAKGGTRDDGARFGRRGRHRAPGARPHGVAGGCISPALTTGAPLGFAVRGAPPFCAFQPDTSQANDLNLFHVSLHSVPELSSLAGGLGLSGLLAQAVPADPQPDLTLWHWLAFGALVIVLLVIDLVVFHRDSREPTLRESAIWTVVWCLIALAFNGLIWHWRGGVRRSSS